MEEEGERRTLLVDMMEKGKGDDADLKDKYRAVEQKMSLEDIEILL